jgi:phosphoribosylamine--glycine ligase
VRICLASKFGYGLWFAWKFREEGHTSTFQIKIDKPSEEHFVTEAWKGILDEGREGQYNYENISADTYDLIVYDIAFDGKGADRVREILPVIGSSALAQRLEDDRLFALDFMQKCGIKIPQYEAFDNPADAIRYIKKRDKRMVFKPVGDIDDKGTTYVAKSSEDMLKFFDKVFRNPKIKEFVLQDYVEGTECATNCWINASGYYAISHDAEVKKFMNGNLGANNGCSGNLVWMARGEDQLFKKGLAKCVEPLQSLGYVGPMDLATIVNPEGVWGLEFTPRFAYDTTGPLTRLIYPDQFGDFLYAIATDQAPPIPQVQYPFCASVRLSIPPYPNDLPDKFYQMGEGTPVGNLEVEGFDEFFASDVRAHSEGSDELETAGLTGFIGCPLGVGDDPIRAFEEVYDCLKQIEVPNAQYRTDICEDSCRRYWQLKKDGWLREEHTWAGQTTSKTA